MRLLIVEDNDRLASLMAKLMTAHGHTVDVAATVDEACAACRIVEYDVVVLDLTLPDGDGREVLNFIRNGKGAALVLVVTAQDDIVSRVQVLNAGADDYIVKPVDDDELIARVRALGRRGREIREEVLALGNVRLDTASLSLTVDGRLVGIPPREFSALATLMASVGQVLRREKLERAVYSFGAEVSVNAVEATVSRLRRRLEAASASIEIVAMRGIGYVLVERLA
jgi:DNA-binding response OmpR family regulator